MKPFPKTDRSDASQFPAVDERSVGSKGLETDGNKPLMQNRRAPAIMRHRDRVTAGNTFIGGSFTADVVGPASGAAEVGSSRRPFSYAHPAIRVLAVMVASIVCMLIGWRLLFWVVFAALIACGACALFGALLILWKPQSDWESENQ